MRSEKWETFLLSFLTSSLSLFFFSRAVEAQSGQLQRFDPPLAADLLVGLMIMAVAVQGGLAVGPLQLVLHRPDAARRRIRRHVDLRHVAVMHCYDAFKNLAHER